MQNTEFLSEQILRMIINTVLTEKQDSYHDHTMPTYKFVPTDCIMHTAPGEFGS